MSSEGDGLTEAVHRREGGRVFHQDLLSPERWGQRVRRGCQGGLLQSWRSGVETGGMALEELRER